MDSELGQLTATDADNDPMTDAMIEADSAAVPTPATPAQAVALAAAATSQADAAAHAATLNVRTVIEPRSGWQAINFGEIWRYRELLAFLVWRDVKVRYKQTVLGVMWAIIQPVMTMVVFSIFFGRFGGMAQNVEGNYSVFVYAAILPWQLFAGAIGHAGNSLVSSGALISKVYFPRLIIPISSIGSNVVDFGFSFLVMLALMVYHGVPITPAILLLPVLLAIALLTALGIGTLLAALVIAYRDFRYVMGFLVQLWMFASPVAYPLHVIPAQYQLIYSLNPMVGVIEGFRSCLLGTPMPWASLAVSLFATAAFLVIGLFYFRKTERRFADIV